MSRLSVSDELRAVHYGVRQARKVFLWALA